MRFVHYMGLKTPHATIYFELEHTKTQPDLTTPSIPGVRIAFLRAAGVTSSGVLTGTSFYYPTIDNLEDTFSSFPRALFMCAPAGQEACFRRLQITERNSCHLLLLRESAWTN